MNDGEKSWRCLVCGYVHTGVEPPDECPVCGAPVSEFELLVEEKPVTENRSALPKVGKIVIAGAGIAGVSAAEAARDAAPESEIVLLSGESEGPYYRLNLTRYLADEIGDTDLPIHPESWYAEHRIELRLNTRMMGFQPLDKTAELATGETIEYEKLIVTTGADPFVPPIAGAELPHVTTLRTASDAKAILEQVKPGMQVVGIGGGILGLETAGALARRGAEVTVLEAFEHLMPRQLNAAGGEVLLKHMDSLNISVLAKAQAERITLTEVQLKDGRSVPADLVIITVGVRSNIQSLEAAGLPVNRGVLVDNFMRTSNPDIFAAGDVCEHDGVMYGSWAAAQYQGKIAGMNAAGVPTEFGGIPRSHMLKILGKDMFSIGTIKATDGSFRCIEEQSDEDYCMFMLRDERLEGALLLGNLKWMPALTQAIQERMDMKNIQTADEAKQQLNE